MDLNLIFIVVVGVLSILFGLFVIMKPKILPYIVGVYFIVSGVLWILRAIL